MPKSADISTKRLISLAPESWAQWVTQIPDIVAGEIISSEFQLDSALVRQIMRWDMAVLTESPWYQQILKEGEQRGRQQEAVTLIMRQLTRRFGLLAPEIQERLRRLSLDQLEELSEVLLDFVAIADLDTWLHEREVQTQA